MKREDIKTAEEILKGKGIAQATKHHSYEYLFSKINDAMIEFGKQFIDLAAEEAEVEGNAENKSFYRLKQSILNIKELIK
jgi:hypothetical protein